MEPLRSNLIAIQAAYDDLASKLGLVELAVERDELATKMAATGFWDDVKQAQDISKKHAKLVRRLEPWEYVRKQLSDAQELLALNDESVVMEITKDLQAVEDKLAVLREEIKFAGRYDTFDAIISIHSGAGGTDAQDWAQMLLRMYTRWAETHDATVELIELNQGEEAGIKSATLSMSGDFMYGKLKGEHGVHRLVRLSPFNADNLRQTSFAKVEVMPKIDEPEVLQLDEKDLKIDVYRSGGHGGQSVNTTDSAVRITHLPTGIVVAIQNERSQLQNRETAFTILRSRLAQLAVEQHLEAISEIKGPNQSAEWGNQIRSYVLHPYQMVKDMRTGYETSETQKVLDGDLDGFIDAYLSHTIGS